MCLDPLTGTQPYMMGTEGDVARCQPLTGHEALMPPRRAMQHCFMFGLYLRNMCLHTRASLGVAAVCKLVRGRQQGLLLHGQLLPAAVHEPHQDLCQQVLTQHSRHPCHQQCNYGNHPCHRTVLCLARSPCTATPWSALRMRSLMLCYHVYLGGTQKNYRSIFTTCNSVTELN